MIKISSNALVKYSSAVVNIVYVKVRT